MPDGISWLLVSAAPGGGEWGIRPLPLRCPPPKLMLKSEVAMLAWRLPCMLGLLPSKLELLGLLGWLEWLRLLGWLGGGWVKAVMEDRVPSRSVA